MEKSKVDWYLANYAKYFQPYQIPVVKQKLEDATEEQMYIIQSLDLRDPMIVFIVSILVGTLGIDRFLIGDIGMGILKLLTGGCCGVLTIIDWFNIMKKTKEYNFSLFMSML